MTVSSFGKPRAGGGRGERGVGWRKENKGVPRLKSSAAIRCTLDNEQKRRQQVQHVVKDVKSKVV